MASRGRGGVLELTRFGGHVMARENGVHDAKDHPPYPPESRRQMVELVRWGRSAEALAKELEPSSRAIRTWVRQAEGDAGPREVGTTTAEGEELRQLHRENKRPKLQREILAKAAAWFAGETESIPPEDSNS